MTWAMGPFEAKYAKALKLSLAVVEGGVVAGVVVDGVVVVVAVEVVKGLNELVPPLPTSEEPEVLPLPLETAVGTVLIAPALPKRPPTVPVLLLVRVGVLVSWCSTRRRTSA